ncbi:hypothetical protein EJ110_NYTH08564 [Nymphaea thermarum]|nr:hypothetical protein EJ110_NYTH08564 [Nymphaea thermarum]
MSMPLEGQPNVIQQQAYSPRSSSGSIGPVIGVLAVIAVLGVVAAIIGRLCSGRRFIGDRRFDFEGWVERKCASCIDGRIDNSGAGGGGGFGGGSSGGGGNPATVTVEATPESKPPTASDSNSASSV